jgi:hypothetical protein
MINKSEYTSECFDYEMLHKFALFLVNMADDILSSTVDDTSDENNIYHNYNTMQSRYISLKNEYDKFLSLLDQSPHINPEFKKKVFSIKFNSLTNQRVSLFQRLLVLLSFGRDTFSDKPYVSGKVYIRSNTIMEFRDRMSEIAIETRLNYLT